MFGIFALWVRELALLAVGDNYSPRRVNIHNHKLSALIPPRRGYNHTSNISSFHTAPPNQITEYRLQNTDYRDRTQKV
jgi:hypothetical protein